MSTAVEPGSWPVPGSPEDPFRYGWRYVRRTDADGRVVTEQVPLSLEDVLHPEEGDFHALTMDHKNVVFYLYIALKTFLEPARPGSLVLADHRVAWDVPGVRAHGPDVSVFLGVRGRWNGRRGTFDVGEQRVRPTILIEVVSESTRGNDVVHKLDHYHRAGVPFYVIIDLADTPDGPSWRLHGYRNTPEGYVEFPLDERNRLPLSAIGVELGVAGVQVVAYDLATGEPLLEYDELKQALDTESEARRRFEEIAASERARAEAAQTQADAATAQAEAERARAEAAQLQAEAERARAEEARVKAQSAEAHRQEAEAKAAAEAARRAALEARLRELEAELGREQPAGDVPDAPNA